MQKRLQQDSAVYRPTTGLLRRFPRIPFQQLVSLKIIVALGLVSGFVLSWRLWVSSRLFPLSPVSVSLPAVPFPLDTVWLCTLLGLLLAVILTTRPRKLILLFLVLAGLLGLWDQQRWQPWFVEYFFLLAAVGLYGWNKAGRHAAALNTCRLIMVCTYLWSGLQKLNANFVRETWPDIATSVLRRAPERLKRLPPCLILIIPALEIMIALGLVTRKYRNASVLVAIATHVFVLILLVSSGENTVVWPWNIAMAALVVVLFWHDKETTTARILVPANTFHAAALLFFGLLPVLSFFDQWDSYLSAALYSGNTDQAVIYVSAAAMGHLPEAIQPHIWKRSEPFFLDINRWAYGELNVPVYPEPRVYRQVTAQVCQYAGSFSGDIRLRIKKKPNPLTGARESEYYDCDHLF